MVWRGEIHYLNWSEERTLYEILDVYLRSPDAHSGNKEETRIKKLTFSSVMDYLIIRYPFAKRLGKRAEQKRVVISGYEKAIEMGLIEFEDGESEITKKGEKYHSSYLKRLS